MHKNDQNFVTEILYKMVDFLELKDEILARPEQYASIIREMKIEALLVTDNSPYANVRAVVSTEDDPEMPSLTFRVWFLGTVLLGIGESHPSLTSY